MTTTEEITRYEIVLQGRSAPLKPFLRRLGHKPSGTPAVVLLHGGNTSGDTFLYPEGGLAGFLSKKGFDVWLLEWRSSPHIVGPLLQSDRPLGGTVIDECHLFTLDAVVEGELPAALDIVRGEIRGADLSLLGHCFGSAAVSIAIARGHLERFRVSSVVLSTLGLFVEVPWNGWIKAEDFIMERVLHNDPKCRAIDPHSLRGWAQDMRTAYDHWPSSWLPAEGSGQETLLRRLSFMFGQPYSIDRIHPNLRHPAIARFFGPMHIGLFLHASQMVRRGYAAKFDAPDVIDRPRLRQATPATAPDGDLLPKHFLDKRITLLAAGENHLWHRDSVDLMYEWLRAHGRQPQPRRPVKHVFAGYNLQELMWGIRAQKEVFPLIEQAIHPPGWKPRRSEVSVASPASLVADPPVR